MNDKDISRRGALMAGAGLAAATLTGTGTARASVARPAALTRQQQAGQRVIYSYSGTTVPQALLNQISAGQAAGVIFFGDNISSLDQITAVCRQLQAANQASPVTAPLLLMTDQEGGQVRRLPGGPALSEKQIGQSSDPVSAAATAGQQAGQLLAGVGMNVNLAPVLDVYRQAGDFDDQYGRSYSTDPDVCARCGSAFITAQQAAGVAATAKHFPGLGAATSSQNTDLRPVTLTVSMPDLRSIDEVPYPPAISAGVQLVMLSWAIYTAFDSARPAGLSPAVVQELRGRLGYQGVTVTDAINAGALASFGTYAQRSVSAAQAGMDLMLVCSQKVSDGQAVVTGLAGALQNGSLSQSAFDAARTRVTTLRQTLA